jgi:valyl-tRNA synthetase
MMDKAFNFKEREPELYKAWESSGAFTPAIDPAKKPFTIIMPPPNVNGVLHAGHAMEVSLQDLMIRFHRMKGEPTLWLPSVDHAGIATQISYEKVLDKQGKTRFDLGREEFVRQTMEFSLGNRSTIESQLRTLGASVDWSRKKFTLDSDVSNAVVFTFHKLYKDGLIYRGERIINWCPRCATGVSDLEVNHVEEEGTLTYIKYPLSDGSGFITVATTRPETMLGDTGVAVNPEDVRYSKLIGKMVKLPIVDREIPIVGDEVVDMEFGTGAVKVTPAHSMVDFEIAERHGLPKLSVIGKNVRMLDEAGEFGQKKVSETRELVVAKLQGLDLIDKQVPHTHSVSRCERCNSVIEPLLSEQWFVKVAPLAKEAIAAVRSGKIKIVPDRFEKIYLQWMENLRDWNISRQLWWGHRVPVYYLESDRTKWVVAESMDIASKDLGGAVVQDEDTLDTWFSSGLWPFTTLGWPEETVDYKYFYPTSVMAPGRDILTFWVSRMIMLGLYNTGQVPFETVSLHGLVNDAQGKKMSKSKGNGVDPVAMVEKYGADALRLTLVVSAMPGADLALSEDRIRGYRNFANKVWNIARFVEMTLNGNESAEMRADELDETTQKFVERWAEVKKETGGLIEKFRFDLAADLLYHFAWDEMAADYLEYAKDKTGKEGVRAALKKVLMELLIVLHPFVPFVTEAVWAELFPDKELLISQRWPD